MADRQRIDIYADGSALLSRREGRAWRRTTHVEASGEVGTPEFLVHGLDRLLPALTRGSLDLVFPDSWCRLYLTRTPSNAGRLSDLEDAARARFRSLYELDADKFELRIAPRANGSFVCCAISRSLSRQLRDLGKAAGSRADSIRPRFLHSLSRCKPKPAWTRFWFMSCEGHGSTIGMHDGTRVVALVQAGMPIRHWRPEDIALMAEREAFRAGVDLPNVIALAGPSVPDRLAQGEDGIAIVPIVPATLARNDASSSTTVVQETA